MLARNRNVPASPNAGRTGGNEYLKPDSPFSVQNTMYPCAVAATAGYVTDPGSLTATTGESRGDLSSRPPVVRTRARMRASCRESFHPTRRYRRTSRSQLRMLRVFDVGPFVQADSPSEAAPLIRGRGVEDALARSVGSRDRRPRDVDQIVVVNGQYRAVLGTARQFPAVLAYPYGSIERGVLTRRSRHSHVAQIGRIDVAECHQRDAVARDGRARLAAETDVRRHRAFDRFAVRPPDGMKHILPRG